ncbi:MAG: phospholipase D-like domain-containing protein [Casimicrobiaceae bacterium]
MRRAPAEHRTGGILPRDCGSGYADPDTRRARAFCLALVTIAMLAFAQGLPVSAHGAVIARAGTVEILFTPGDGIDRRIVAAIDAAHDEVHVLAYVFTHRGIARALRTARERGVVVEIVVDRIQGIDPPGSAVPDLRRHGAVVWLDPGPGSAHNKVMIIDPRSPAATTISGSFNFTRAAQTSNAENVIIFHRNRDVARIYDRYFLARRAAAQRWQGGAIPARQPPGPATTKRRGPSPHVEHAVP